MKKKLKKLNKLKKSEVKTRRRLAKVNRAKNPDLFNKLTHKLKNLTKKIRNLKESFRKLIEAILELL